jgi:hypothetical protein
MKPIADYAGRTLAWTQPAALRMEYELRSGDDVLATLKLRSSFGSLATAESGDGCWTFKRVGFLSTRVTIRPCGSETEVATFRNNTWSSGGSLELEAGRKIMATSNFWQTQYQFQTESEEALVRFKSSGLIRVHSAVEITPAGTRLRELPLLVLLGFYLVVMMRSDAAVAS